MASRARKRAKFYATYERVPCACRVCVEMLFHIGVSVRHCPERPPGVRVRPSVGVKDGK